MLLWSGTCLIRQLVGRSHVYGLQNVVLYQLHTLIKSASGWFPIDAMPSDPLRFVLGVLARCHPKGHFFSMLQKAKILTHASVRHPLPAGVILITGAAPCCSAFCRPCCDRPGDCVRGRRYPSGGRRFGGSDRIRGACLGGRCVILPSNRVCIMAATKPIDFHKGHDSLAAMVKNELRKVPSTGTVFAFRARKADRLKLLYRDHTGLVMAYKRLEE